ncbi:MAG: hypothetical protein KAH11_08385 [Rhodospirillales bacterium]|nr:hypothetical protein [Rhodospirillales bacterium]
MKKKNREFDIFSLSFLDVISCGFGAVVLLVLISNNAQAPIKSIEDEARALLEKVLGAEEENALLRERLSANQQAITSKTVHLDRLASMSNASAESLQSTAEALEGLQADLSGLATVQSSLERMKRAAVSKPQTSKRDDEVGGIPVDSDYVIFIVDTSGSMKEIWGRVTAEVENVIRIHPKIKGFQVLNDNGAHMITGYEGRWIPDTPGRRESAINFFKVWTSASNSSPVEGLEVALKRYVNPNTKVSIYIFGDEYSGSSYDPVINALASLNTNRASGGRMARVHAVGFISNYSTGRFATLMREVTRRNDGTFVALPR